MSIIGTYQKVPESSSQLHRKKTFITLQCNVCDVIFDRDFNIKAHLSKSRHYCSFSCHAISMKSGGLADESRKTTCRETYGFDYYISNPEIATKAAVAAQSDKSNLKRKNTRMKNLEDPVFQETRAKSITRSKTEIQFIDALRKSGLEILDTKYLNGWWFDGYIPSIDAWVQFDGTYWHSIPENKLRDEKQNEWFATNGLSLIRVTDKEWKNDPDEVISRLTKVL